MLDRCDDSSSSAATAGPVCSSNVTDSSKPADEVNFPTSSDLTDNVADNSRVATISHFNHAKADVNSVTRSADDSYLANRDAFPVQKLPGEVLLRVSTCGQKRSLSLTCYRLVWLEVDSHSQLALTIVPTRAIDSAVSADRGLKAIIYLKDGRTLRYTFLTIAECSEWVCLLNNLTKGLSDPRSDLPAFRYFGHRCHVLPRTVQPTPQEIFDFECKRLGFSLSADGWRVSDVNGSYQVCNSYPQLHVVPQDIQDSVLIDSGHYRTHGRFPSVVWRSPCSGNVLIRASQPRVGVIFTNCGFPADQQLVRGVLNAVRSDRTRLGLISESNQPSRQLLVIDCRDLIAIRCNQLVRGGGTESVTDYDQHGLFECCDLPNMSKVCGFFNALRERCANGQSDDLTISNSEWMRLIGQLLTKANRVVSALVDDQMSVLVHCSDGWDRTPQLVALAKLLIDPFYRTVAGFMVLIEREFVGYGHKFAARCGHDPSSGRDECSPIFVQFLDCVFQLLLQHPTAFEFTDALLLKLAYHVYSCLFSTFICNTSRERDEFNRETLPVWQMFFEDSAASILTSQPSWKYLNPRYNRSASVAVLRADASSVQLWRALYLNCAGSYIEPSAAAVPAVNNRLGRALPLRIPTADNAPVLSRTLSEGCLSPPGRNVSLQSLGKRRSPTAGVTRNEERAWVHKLPRSVETCFSVFTLQRVLDEIATGRSDCLVDSDGLLLTVNRSNARLALKRTCLDGQSRFEEEHEDVPSAYYLPSAYADHGKSRTSSKSVDSSLVNMNMTLDDTVLNHKTSDVMHAARRRLDDYANEVVDSTSWEIMDFSDACDKLGVGRSNSNSNRKFTSKLRFDSHCSSESHSQPDLLAQSVRGASSRNALAIHIY